MFDIVRAESRAPRTRRSRAGSSGRCGPSCSSASGLDFEQAKAAAQAPRLPAGPAEGDAERRLRQPTRKSSPRTMSSALLPGSRHPDETLIYSAHWDHLGVGKPDATGDTIYNGAVDNATGIAQLIEQARAFAHGPRPERSVVFLAVTARGKGPARVGILRDPPALSARQDGRGAQHRRDERRGVRPAISRSREAPSSACSTT